MNILFVSPEVSPLVRTGGLGDVVGSLPIALKNLNLDVRILCPLHRCCKTRDVTYFEDTFQIGGRKRLLQAKDIADVIQFVVTRPAHVNIADTLIFPTAQVASTMVDRK